MQWCLYFIKSKTLSIVRQAAKAEKTCNSLWDHIWSTRKKENLVPNELDITFLSTLSIGGVSVSVMLKCENWASRNGGNSVGHSIHEFFVQGLMWPMTDAGRCQRLNHFFYWLFSAFFVVNDVLQILTYEKSSHSLSCPTCLSPCLFLTLILQSFS